MATKKVAAPKKAEKKPVVVKKAVKKAPVAAQKAPVKAAKPTPKVVEAPKKAPEAPKPTVNHELDDFIAVQVPNLYQVARTTGSNVVKEVAGKTVTIFPDGTHSIT